MHKIIRSYHKVAWGVELLCCDGICSSCSTVDAGLIRAGSLTCTAGGDEVSTEETPQPPRGIKISE